MNELLECKINDAAVKASGEISGIASVFDVEDHGHDIVKQGAFKATLKKTGGLIPLLFNHQKQIGWVTNAKETKLGLSFTAKLDIKNNASALEAFSLAQTGIKLGAAVGLSIGYIPTEKSYDDDYRVRTLHSVDLKEISLAAVPMNPEAMLTSVKAQGLTTEQERIDDINDLELALDKAFNSLEQMNERT